MVDRFPGNPHEINEVKISGPEMFAGYMVLDTGCQRTCRGLQWAQAHESRLKESGLHPKKMEFPNSFKFGKGAPSHSTMKGYYPSAIGGQPLVLAASTLNEQIPFLASNSLLTGLGAVFNLVNDSIVFTRLGGVKAEVCRLGGHMALCISDFQSDEPSKMQVWQEFSSDVDWRCPPPEFILSSQTREVSLSDVAYHLADDSTATNLVEAMEKPNSAHQVPREEYDREHAPSDQHGIAAPRRASRTTTPFGAEGESRNVQPCQMQEVRQCTREVRNMPPMRNEMDLEQGPQQMGGSSHERGAEGWIKRLLFALAAFASTFLGNNRKFFAGCSPCKRHTRPGLCFHGRGPRLGLCIPVRVWTGHGPTSTTWTTPWITWARPSIWKLGTSWSRTLLSTVLLATSTRRPSSPRRSASPTGWRCSRKQIWKGGNAWWSWAWWQRKATRSTTGRILQLPTIKALARDCGVCGTDLPRPWMQSIRSMLHRSQQRIDHHLRLIFGNYSLDELYVQNLPENINWKLCSLDLIYGQDFQCSSTRSHPFDGLDRFKPLLVMLGIDCRHYNLSNKNLTYSQRLEEWEQLQQEDRPLLTFTTSIGRRLWEAGRYFFIENPIRSELWSMPQITRLPSLQGVYVFELDAGAFGAEIDGNPVIKTFTGLWQTFLGLTKCCREDYLNNNERCVVPSKVQLLADPRSTQRRCAVRFFYIYDNKWHRCNHQGFVCRIRHLQFRCQQRTWRDGMRLSATLRRASKEDPRPLRDWCNPHPSGVITDNSSDTFECGWVYDTTPEQPSSTTTMTHVQLKLRLRAKAAGWLMSRWKDTKIKR